MKNLTLRMVFILFILIANTLVFSGYMAYYYLTIKAEMAHELKNSADSISEWLSGALRMPLWVMDKKTTEDIIVSGMNKQVWAVIVTDEFNKSFFGMKRNKDWQLIKNDEVNFKGNFIKAHRDIFDKESKLGKVEVYLTPIFMESQLTRSINSMMLALFILNIIIFSIIYFFVQYVIIRPITATVTCISRLSTGDIPKIVMKPYIGEFNRIIESLNILIETTHETTRISNEIASGNISIDIVGRSENDQQMNALKMMIQKLNAIMTETNGMIQKVSEGKHNVHGDAEAFQGVWRDLITGVNHLMDVRMQAAEKLLESEERLKLVLDGSQLGFWDWKIQTNEVYRNEQWAKMLGYTLQEIKFNVNQWTDLIHPDDRAMALQSIQNHLENRTLMHKIEYRMLCKNGQWKWILDQARIVKRDDKGQPVRMSGTHTDITERILIENELRQTQKLESIGILAGGIAHDFNNMLSIISGNVSYALSKMNQYDDFWEALKDVETGTKQAQKLTQQLLTFAKGGAPIKKEADLQEILKESATFITRGSKARCEFKFQEDLWTVVIDTGQMNQAISNLVINATQAMQEGGLIQIQAENKTLSPNENILLPPGNYVKISVKDNGIGISEKNISKIFDPYFTTKQKGSGLGLATTYSIIKRHNGHISVESKIDKGTTFYIYLPATQNTLVVNDKQEKQVEHRGYGKILLMDDEKMILDMTGRLLNFMGYETVFAMDGKQAMDIYTEAFKSQHPFDLVILDLTVPAGMGGAKTVQELLKIDPYVKAIVSSGYSNDPIMANYQDYGFCGVLAKPFTKAEIEDALKKIFSV
ncbi:MAG: PAS domain-containing protein [Desulfobacterales bacterium]|nr:PAS domain-containing protein [Desulfobacterales bacterium]